jgi:hypothetical protein
MKSRIRIFNTHEDKKPIFLLDTLYSSVYDKKISRDPGPERGERGVKRKFSFTIQLRRDFLRLLLLKCKCKNIRRDTDAGEGEGEGASVHPCILGSTVQWTNCPHKSIEGQVRLVRLVRLIRLQTDNFGLFQTTNFHLHNEQR